MAEAFLRFSTSAPSHRVSELLHGIFFEDINFASDGGINANMVDNYSFDGIYLDIKSGKPVSDSLRYWIIKNGTIESETEGSLSENSRYARVKAAGGCRLENLGYNGRKANKDRCAMYASKDNKYEFECFARSKDGCEITVFMADGDDEPLTDKTKIKIKKGDWAKVSADLFAKRTGYGKLVIALEDAQLDIDCVQLRNADWWNSGEAKWSGGKLRRDLVSALAELKPKFVRFPGGCIVEGKCAGNEYNWKDTVGPLYARKHNFNLWAEKISDGGYCQSFQIGFYEYFCLCEDLGAKPLPTLFAGINCQVRSRTHMASNSPEFRDYVIQNYLDLIEFANGDPQKNEWARLRADMGHPAPFGLDRIGVGNENFGRDYREKFDLISAAIAERYPDILCVMSAGVFPFRFCTKPFWRHAAKLKRPVLIDEHSYHSPRWFIRAAKRFDDYPRGAAKLYFGEYAANGLMAVQKQSAERANSFDSALAEAAFLTGVERNSDVVAMSSYAPLFNLVGSEQWHHNLLDFSPSQVCRSANYMVQKLFSCNTGDRYIPFEGVLPAGVFCSASADKGRLYIKAVNTTAHALDISFEAEGCAGEAEVQTFFADGPSAKNRLNFTGEAISETHITTSILPLNAAKVTLRLCGRSAAAIIMNFEGGKEK